MVPDIRVGYACTPAALPFKTSRSFILKNFNEDIFIKCVSENIKDLMNILQWNIKNDIYIFRISSDIIPFGSHEANSLKWQDIFRDELLACGQYITENNIRVSMHPGQYTVLNSPREEVVLRSAADVEYHCSFLDALGVDGTNKIVLHTGGVYGDKKTAAESCIRNFKKLSASAQRRLVIENDDKSYTVEDVLAICAAIHIPAVFDNLHHFHNPCNMELGEIIQKVYKTWKGEDGTVKLHYSDQDVNKKNGSHSQFVSSKNFLRYVGKIKEFSDNSQFNKFDIMLEVKDKEVSAVKCTNLLRDKVPISKINEEWAKYKYSVMEKNYSLYKECSRIVNSKRTAAEVYGVIEEALMLPYDKGNFINTAEHVYGYIKNKVTEKEKASFFELLGAEDINKDKVKSLLKRLCEKYGVNYLNESYYFIYN